MSVHQLSNEDRENILAISLSKSISHKQLRLYRDGGGKIADLMRMEESRIAQLGLLKRGKTYDGHKELRSLAKRTIGRCEDIGMFWKTIEDELYPKSLLEIYEPPFVLYGMGDEEFLGFDFMKSLSVVGTRKCSDFISQFTKNFASKAAEQGMCIISGMAAGVDAAAHQGVLDANGQTICVLAGGANHIYPQSNKLIYKRVVEGAGAVISEYPPDTKPQAYYFPLRNRIIAGLSRATFLPQAPESSGALITVMHALEQGKMVYVFNPPPSAAKDFQGNIKLRDSGALAVGTTEELLDDFFQQKEKLPYSNFPEPYSNSPDEDKLEESGGGKRFCRRYRWHSRRWRKNHDVFEAIPKVSRRDRACHRCESD